MSPSRSFIWINWPAWILETIFAGTGGRAEASIRPWLLSVEAVAASMSGKEPIANDMLDGAVNDAGAHPGQHDAGRVQSGQTHDTLCQGQGPHYGCEIGAGGRGGGAGVGETMDRQQSCV